MTQKPAAKTAGFLLCGSQFIERTVIARSEATWQSPGISIQPRNAYIICLALSIVIRPYRPAVPTGRLPRAVGPRNDIVVGDQHQKSNCLLNPNYAFYILNSAFRAQHDKPPFVPNQRGILRVMVKLSKFFPDLPGKFYKTVIDSILQRLYNIP